MKYVAVYARVSSKRQDLRSQKPDLETWVKSHENGTPVKWFCDKCSGRTMNRPAWCRLEAEIDAGRVSQLVTWRIDRLGRSAAGLVSLFDTLNSRKINLVSLRDGLDLSTPSGRLMANVIASMASYENEIRTERILAGQAVARTNGKRWGGSQLGRRLSVVDEQVAIAKRLRSEGMNISAISRAVNLSRPTIYRLLREAS